MWYHAAMREQGAEKHRNSVWPKLMPYVMWLLPVLVLNIGFSFLANIELHWKEREQDETAQQELEALTSSSTTTYRMNRLAGLLTVKIKTVERMQSEDAEIGQQLEELGQSHFQPFFSKYKLHVFRKKKGAQGFELFFAHSDRVESKRAMGMVFNYLVDQHKGVDMPLATIKQRDKFAESYFGKTIRSEALANSQKGRTTTILHNDLPHWFIWDYHENIGDCAWGYLVTAEIREETEIHAMQQAVKECSMRRSGLAGFIPVISKSALPVCSAEMAGSLLFRRWLKDEVRPLGSARAVWLRHGPPPPALLGNFKVYTHMGQDTDYLTLFLARRPVKAELPIWLKMLNFFTGAILMLLTLRGLILNRWLEPGLTLRFMILYFLATTFPLGLLSTADIAYQYQTARSEQNQIADKLDSCLKQVESTKMRFQEDYRNRCLQAFSDRSLADTIAAKGFRADAARDRVLSFFGKGEDRLPLIGFYLLDTAGNGMEFVEEASSLRRLRDIFAVYRAPIIENLRKKILLSDPQAQLPEFKVADEEKFGAQAFGSLSGSTLGNEIERRRSQYISQYSGQVNATIMYEFIKVTGQNDALLFFAWDGGRLFEKSIGISIDGFRHGYPDFSFVAFRNNPQGLRILYRQENDELVVKGFRGAVDTAETAAARGGTVRRHLAGFTMVAMPYGSSSEYIIAGIAGHDRIRADETWRQRLFLLLTICSLLIAAICAWFTSAFLLKPITGLKQALDRVSDGDYSVGFDASRPDELGKLTGAFARMVEGLEERKRLSALLSDHAVEALTRGDAANQSDDSRTFEGIALVSDIRSFTTLCETWPTDQITSMLNHHIAAMTGVIAACGGRIYKFIGDAIEAVFEDEDPRVAAMNAVTAAVRMNDAIKELNRRRRAEGLFTYAFGVGLARGNFYAGSVGSADTRLDYSIIGEHFHRAANLEALTKKCSELPIIFDAEIAGLLQDSFKSAQVNDDQGAMTFAAGEAWVSEVISAERAVETDRQQSVAAVAYERGESVSAQEGQHNLLVLLAVAIFAVLTGTGVYQGVAWQKQLSEKQALHTAEEQNARLVGQLKSENAPVSSMENRLAAAINDLQAEIPFRYSPGQTEIISSRVQAAVGEFRAMGIIPSRVFAVSTDHEDPENSCAAYSFGLTDEQKDFFYLLAQYLTASDMRNSRPEEMKKLNSKVVDYFGTNVDVGPLVHERVGCSGIVRNGESLELLFWNYIRVMPEEMRKLPLPQENHKLTQFDRSRSRIAGVVIFAVPYDEVRGSLQLLANDFSTGGCEVSIKTLDGREFSSNGFAKSWHAAGTGESRDSVLEEKGVIGNRECLIKVVRSIPVIERVGLYSAKIVLGLLVLLAVFYTGKTLYAESAMKRSIQVKLIVSMMVTAVIPMLTVKLVADSFVFQNHQALLHQQLTEMQRYLDSFELRSTWYERVLAEQLRGLSADPRILKLSEALDKDPKAAELLSEMRSFFSEAFKAIDLDSDWASNATARDLIMIGRNGWNVSYNKKAHEIRNKEAANSPGGDTNAFASLLSQLGRHILNRIDRKPSGESLKMQDLKGEMFFDGAMRSIRSNFGDEAYIRLNSTFSRLVEFEITTGAALLLVTALPAIENPAHLLIWLVSVSRGGYMTRIARMNQGQFAVAAMEYAHNGRVMNSYNLYPGLDLRQASSWIAGSNLPVAFVQKVADEKVSIYGRPGTRQTESFLMALASQSMIDRASRRIRRLLFYFLLFSVLLFLFIGVQTASDIMLPVRALTEGMQQIGGQNYFYRIGLDRRDELGQLCASFDRFARGLAEKELMGKMLSRSARDAVSGGDTLAEGRRNFVLIYLSSLDFARHLEAGKTTELFSKLKDQVSKLCRIVIEEGGDIDKLMGDKILGVFPADEHPEQARLAAIRAVTRIMQVEQDGGLHFPIAIGVNAGEVICGMLGFGEKRDFTVIGDAVNVSARIEKEAEKMPEKRCLYSESFVAGLTDGGQFTKHSVASLKGKAEKMQLFCQNR